MAWPRLMRGASVARLLAAALWLLPLVDSFGDRHAVLLSRFGGICNADDRSQSAFRALIDELMERQALPTKGRRMCFIPTAAYAPSDSAPLAAQRAEFRAAAEEKADEFKVGTSRSTTLVMIWKPALATPLPTTTTATPS